MQEPLLGLLLPQLDLPLAHLLLLVGGEGGVVPVAGVLVQVVVNGLDELVVLIHEALDAVHDLVGVLADLHLGGGAGKHLHLIPHLDQLGIVCNGVALGVLQGDVGDLGGGCHAVHRYVLVELPVLEIEILPRLEGVGRSVPLHHHIGILPGDVGNVVVDAVDGEVVAAALGKLPIHNNDGVLAFHHNGLFPIGVCPLGGEALHPKDLLHGGHCVGVGGIQALLQGDPAVLIGIEAAALGLKVGKLGVLIQEVPAFVVQLDSQILQGGFPGGFPDDLPILEGVQAAALLAQLGKLGFLVQLLAVFVQQLEAKVFQGCVPLQFLVPGIHRIGQGLGCYGLAVWCGTRPKEGVEKVPLLLAEVNLLAGAGLGSLQNKGVALGPVDHPHPGAAGVDLFQHVADGVVFGKMKFLPVDGKAEGSPLELGL